MRKIWKLKKENWKKLKNEKKKRKEKTKWGEFVTPDFLSCKDTLCPDLLVH